MAKSSKTSGAGVRRVNSKTKAKRKRLVTNIKAGIVQETGIGAKTKTKK